MNLGIDVSAALPGLRQQAESMMTSKCVVRLYEEKYEATPDPVTGDIAAPFVIQYSGPCRLRLANTAVADIEGQGQILAESSATLSLPVAASGGVSQRAVAEIIDNPADPALVGSVWRIKGLHSQTHATARRFPVEVVTESD